METIIIISLLVIAALTAAFSKNRALIEYTSIISSVIVFIETFLIVRKVSHLGSYSPFTFFSVDSLGAIMLMLISFVSLASTIYSVQYLREETKKYIIGLTRVRQYFVLLNLFVIAMLMATMADNPIFAWIFIEATTLSTVFLISFYNKPATMEAAWKYLIINSVGLLLGFFGTLLYFTSIPNLGENPGIIHWSSLLENAMNLDPMIAKIAFIFVIIGYGTKVGLAPMHTWLPDAHSKAPAPISALLSGVLLNVALITILRFKTITDIAVGHEFAQDLLIILGLLSISISVFVILIQKNYKRLLAYSSIENMGIISLGFGFGGAGIFAGLMHIIYHSLVKSALFLSAGTIFLKYSSTKIENIKGTLRTLPVTSIIFFTGFLIITGTPPFGIFATKLMILSAGIKSYTLVTSGIVILMSVLFTGFFKHVNAMTFGQKPEDVTVGELNIWLVIPPLFLLGAAIYLSFSIPTLFYTLISSATAQLSI